MPSQSQVDSLKQFIGQGEVFNKVTAPTSGQPLSLVVDATSNIGVIPAGTAGSGKAASMGLTSGPAELTYKPDFKGVEIEQAYGDVAPRVTKETVSLKFKCAEATYARIQAALNQADSDVQSQGTTGVVKKWLQVGGTVFYNTDTFALVSKIDSGGHTLYEWVCLYQALSVDGVKLDWKRGETRMVEVTVTGYADVTRPDGDQLFQLGQEIWV